MEVIKKVIHQALTTGTTTGCTGGTCFIIIPNTGVTYYMKLSLVQEVKDLGYFNTYVEPEPKFDEDIGDWIPLIGDTDYDPIPIILGT